MNCVPVVLHTLVKVNILRVSQAGRTMGSTMRKNSGISLAPSMRADSVISSGMPLGELRHEEHPEGGRQRGENQSGVVSMRRVFTMIYCGTAAPRCEKQDGEHHQLQNHLFPRNL